MGMAARCSMKSSSKYSYRQVCRVQPQYGPRNEVCHDFRFTRSVTNSLTGYTTQPAPVRYVTDARPRTKLVIDARPQKNRRDRGAFLRRLAAAAVVLDLLVVQMQREGLVPLGMQPAEEERLLARAALHDHLERRR